MIIDFEQLGMSHDWNENDPTKPGYIKNRPFYTGDPVETVFVEESTVPFVEQGGLYGAEFQSTFTPTGGEIYKVSWDGTVYECTCIDFEGVMFVIGNPSIIGEGSDTGEPFLMIIRNGESGPKQGVMSVYNGESGDRPVYNGRGITIGTLDTSASHIISISGFIAEVVKIDEKYLPDDLTSKISTLSSDLSIKMDNTDPTGSGSFSFNRKANTIIGANSFAEGYQTTASGQYSHAEGWYTTASNFRSHAEGYQTTASGKDSHAEGYQTTASGSGSHAEGYQTTASSNYQHVQGKYNIEDSSGIYADIVGNGSSNGHSNAYTLDWEGNAWYSGTIEGKALILPSSTVGSTKKFKITVDDSGTITATEIGAAS